LIRRPFQVNFKTYSQKTERHQINMILVMMGVTGSGKTTIGKLVAERLQWAFYDGDDFHPPANIEKMSSGIALTDEDRAAWLDTLAELISELVESKRSATLACSALKEEYRAHLKSAVKQNQDAVQFIYLRISLAVARARLKARKNHFMPPTLVDSQFATLEEPGEAIVIDATQKPEQVVRDILAALSL
jgi:gluconokinase